MRPRQESEGSSSSKLPLNVTLRLRSTRPRLIYLSFRSKAGQLTSALNQVLKRKPLKRRRSFPFTC